MRKIVVLLVVFLGMGLFVYFYEVKGRERREEAQKLEESLLRMKQEEITLVEVQRPDMKGIVLKKKADEWTIEEPIETLADGSALDGLLRNLGLASRERTFPEGGKALEKYGLDEPRLTLRVAAGSDEKTILVGSDDYSGNKVYVKFPDDTNVFLTSDYIFSTADKQVEDWRSKKVLVFDRNKVETVHVAGGSDEIRLAQRDGEWFLEAPLEERADQSAVSGLLSALEFGQIQNFVSEEPETLQSYGLAKPKVWIRVRQEAEDRWRALEIGQKKEEAFLARNPDRSPVFTVKEDLFEKITQDVWEFRDKDVIDIEQDQIADLLIRREEEEIRVRREDFKWIIQKPEAQKDQEALGYKFWYPLDEIKFETISTHESAGDSTSFQKPDVEVVITLKDGSTRTFRFAHSEDQYLARKEESGRQGTISSEAYEKLQFKVEDIV